MLALSQDPLGHRDALLQLANLQYRTETYDEAERLARAALRLDSLHARPEDSERLDILNTIGLVLSDTGELEDAAREHDVQLLVSTMSPTDAINVGAGCLLVFIISIGYYITPALLGSPNDQMVSYFVAFYTNTTINWGMATALGGLLLLATMLLYIVYSWLVGASRLRLG